MKPNILHNLFNLFVALIALLASLLLASGQFDWVAGWLYVILHITINTISMILIVSHSPDLLQERFQPNKGAEGWDRTLSTLTTLLFWMILLTSGLDHRYGWTPGFPTWIIILAGCLFFFGEFFSRWAAVINPFYTRVLRIQAERNHIVISTGPYRFVRHPGYAGALGIILTTPLLLGSLLAFIPAGLCTILLILRTEKEDKTLMAALPGYRSYAIKIPYRLIPGVW